MTTQRAQDIIDSTKDLTLRPQQGDRQKVIAAALRAAADRLYTDWGELQHPASVLHDIANEVEELGKVEKQQTLYDVIDEWWEYLEDTLNMENSIQDLVDRIEAWLPKEQSAAGSQNAYVECTVEGFNDALNKIKRKLR